MTTCPNCGEQNSDEFTYCGGCGSAIGDGPFPLQSTICSRRYRIDSVLGQGGMGSVYAATDLQLQRQVAIKVLSPELSQKPNVRRRMEQEARALARIEDPNVVQIRNVFEENGLLVLELELVTGGDLTLRIKHGPMDPADALRLIQQILSGLQALHDADLVHRDIKPGNVLLTKQGIVKLADLGVARDAQALERTSLGAVLGTPAYMSPEQVQGLAVDRRSDLYAAGIVFYEMLTGHLPFAGNSEWELKAAHVQAAPNLAVLQGVVADGVIAVIARALAKAPAERWASARAMAGALAGIVVAERRVEGVRPVRPVVVVPAVDEVLQLTSSRSSGLAAFVGLIVLGVLLLGFVWATRKLEEAPKTTPPVINNRYQVDAKGETVLDTKSKLTWQREATGDTYNWVQAKAYCSGLALAAGGWHLPTKEELESLVDKSFQPTIDPTAFPQAITVEPWFWTATAYSGSVSSAWNVHFDNGYSGSNDISSTGRVRCVR